MEMPSELAIEHYCYTTTPPLIELVPHYHYKHFFKYFEREGV